MFEESGLQRQAKTESVTKRCIHQQACSKDQKFVPKDEGEEGAEEGDASKAKPGDKVPDSAFVTWLRDKETSHAVHVAAKDYLLEGAPFKGDSTFDAKDAIKDLGGTWRRNPDKAKDCYDKSIRRVGGPHPTKACPSCCAWATTSAAGDNGLLWYGRHSDASSCPG